MDNRLYGNYCVGCLKPKRECICDPFDGVELSESLDKAIIERLEALQQVRILNKTD